MTQRFLNAWLLDDILHRFSRLYQYAGLIFSKNFILYLPKHFFDEHQRIAVLKGNAYTAYLCTSQYSDDSVDVQHGPF